ncbi:MAG TPA: tetratricopeptide repeat protein [Polyangia bacterium]|nr:tetratricopeptide repeat protein [Polyangia bacterium]
MEAQRSDTSIDPQLTPAARRFLEETTMKSIFGISDQALDAVMALAYQLYQVGRYAEAEVLCRGLVAADHKYWWSYSLYAATLRRLGRLPEALAELEKGLAYEPNEPKLLFMRSEIREALAQREMSVATPASSTSKTSKPRAAA